MIPEFTDLISPILKLIVQHNDIRFRPLRFSLEKQFGLTTHEQEERTPGGELLMSARMHEALQVLVKDGLVIKMGRVDHQPTEKGRRAVSAGQ